MSDLPCTAQSVPACDECTLQCWLMCRYEPGETMHFFMLALPFFVITIAGVIQSGYGWWLIGWLVYALFFFFVWEGFVLCSHCPFWAREEHMLRCHANYGVFKLWKYRPGPMSRSEQNQFILGAIALLVYPLIFLFLGRQFLFAAIAIVSAVSAGYLLRRNVCSRCVNFSCPMNAVPKLLVNTYLKKNPAIRQAWEQNGYKLG
jgi:hypothetical protein